ncbi:MAG: hypothetical protein KGQ49_02155 [Verrucomicrobia bacterium]|nr:hypothetical protein [Verrucomicrobiota bacterium]
MKRLLILLCLIVVGVFVFLWLIKAPIMSRYLTQKMGVHVRVRSISMWPSVTTIREFSIANPHGYKTRTAFLVDKTRVEYVWHNLAANPHEINLITLNDVFLNIYINDASGKDNNWADIGANMPEKTGDQEVIVHKLILRNLTVKTEGPGAQTLGVAGTQHFDQMEFDEIDSRNGFPTKELIAKIFQGAGLKQFIDRFLNPTNQIKKVINPWNIFGEAPQVDSMRREHHPK